MNRTYVRRGNMDQLKSLLRRPKFYNNIDGVGELGGGIVSLGFAIILWISIGMPVDSTWNRMDLSIACYLLIFFAIDYGNKAVKKRITYPRTGFVEYRKPLPFWAALILIIGLGTLLNVGEKYLERWHGEIESPHWGVTTPAALGGLLFAAFYAYGYARTVRWKRGVAGTMVIGVVAIAMLPADALGALARNLWGHGGLEYRCDAMLFLSLMLYGSLMLISGGVSFVLYMRHTQPAAETAE